MSIPRTEIKFKILNLKGKCKAVKKILIVE